MAKPKKLTPYLLALKYEYLCETFDRTLEGCLEPKDRGGAWRPNRMGVARRHAECQQVSVSEADEDIHWGAIKECLPQLQRKSYEWVCKEYAREFVTINIKEQIDGHSPESK